MSVPVDRVSGGVAGEVWIVESIRQMVSEVSNGTSTPTCLRQMVHVKPLPLGLAPFTLNLL